MVAEESIGGVVSMNEDYELALFSHQTPGTDHLYFKCPLHRVVCLNFGNPALTSSFTKY